MLPPYTVMYMLYALNAHIEVAQNGGTPGKDNTVGKISFYKVIPVTITVI